MASLIVRVCNANRQPLDDSVDVHVISAQTDATVGIARGAPGHSAIRFDDLAEGRPYVIKVFPMRHRPVAQFVMIRPGETPTAQLFAPLDPERATPSFRSYDTMPSELIRVLDVSSVEGT